MKEHNTPANHTGELFYYFARLTETNFWNIRLPGGLTFGQIRQRRVEYPELCIALNWIFEKAIPGLPAFCRERTGGLSDTDQKELLACCRQEKDIDEEKALYYTMRIIRLLGRKLGLIKYPPAVGKAMQQIKQRLNQKNIHSRHVMPK